jgi:hypothetical protein
MSEQTPHSVEVDELRRQFEEAVAAFHAHIIKDHHKDRDCHIYVFHKVDVYSYGKLRENHNALHRLLLNGYLIKIDECFEKIENLYKFGIEKLNEFVAHDTLSEDW